MSNPFILTFGKKPTQYISRSKAIQRILDSFTSTPSPEQIFIITDIRGTVKTVTMIAISKKLQEKLKELTPNEFRSLALKVSF